MNQTVLNVISSICLAFLLSVSCREAPQPVAEAGGRGDVEELRVDGPVILFMGDSLTAGYQLDPAVAYPALIQQKLDQAGVPSRVINAGVSGDTSADGRSRINWLLRQPVDVFVLALGANDALRGLPITQLQENLAAILKATRTRYPEARLVVAGMRMPSNYGAAYTAAFEHVFRDLADEFDAILIPFLLEGVGGQPDLNLADGIHPNEAGHEEIAETVWQFLRAVLIE